MGEIKCQLKHVRKLVDETIDQLRTILSSLLPASWGKRFQCRVLTFVLDYRKKPPTKYGIHVLVGGKQS